MGHFNRRDFLRLAGLGAAAIVVTPGAVSAGTREDAGDGFCFVQLSDTHWGFTGANVNPDFQGTLKKAVAAVNALERQPDFVIFTGDLIQTTPDPVIRRDRMSEFRDIAGQLRANSVRFMPGEHDAALDRGETYQDYFGEMHYTFDHKGVHFVVLDNVSDPGAAVGAPQIQWLREDLSRLPSDARIVVLTHRPLFDLAPAWDWATRDGSEVIKVLLEHSDVTVLYGHIHQEHHHMTGHIAHHAAKSLMWALPEPGSAPAKVPIPWNSSVPYHGLGFRDVKAAPGRYEIDEYPIVSSL